METRELMITNYFVNILKRFYNENKSFKELIDGGLDDYADFYQIDGINCVALYGSSRVCLDFYSSKDSMLDKYVVKIAREIFDECRIQENERQNANEYQNYLKIKEWGLENFFTETIKGPSLTEIFGIETYENSCIYIAEKADVSPDRYYNYIYDYVYDNRYDYTGEFSWYKQDFTIEDLEDEYACNELINCFTDDIESEERYMMVLKQGGITIPSKLEELIYNIRDCHDENVGWIGDRIVMVDYGWSTTFGSRSYDD